MSHTELLAGPEAAPAPTLEVHIAPSRGWVSLGLGELWEYRDVLYFLTWRDILVRYKQTVIGAAWAILRPLMTMAIFSVIFGRVAKIDSDGVPYPIFSFTALVPWALFSEGVLRGADSMVNQANMIKKVYFPRLAMPIAPTLGATVDFVLAFVVLLLMMAWFGIAPGLNALFIPGLVLLAIVTSLGTAFWLSAMNVQFRDVRFAVPFLIQSWLFITPIAYPSSMLDEPWRTLYAINPMAGVVEGFRWALLGTDTQPGAMILVSSVAAVLLLVSGAFYFRRMEKTFADVV